MIELFEMSHWWSQQNQSSIADYKFFHIHFALPAETRLMDIDPHGCVEFYTVYDFIPIIMSV